jgi:hypothetical protein
VARFAFPLQLQECLRNLAGFAAAMLVSWLAGFAVKALCVSSDGLNPGSAAPLVLLLSLAGGGGAFVWLVNHRNNSKPHGGGAFFDKGWATVKAAGLATFAVVAVAWALGALYFSERPADPTADAAGVYRGFDPIAAAAAAAKPMAQKLPGEMAQPLLGLGMLVISGVMLVSMDSYFGIPMLALKLLGGKTCPLPLSFRLSSFTQNSTFSPLTFRYRRLSLTCVGVLPAAFSWEQGAGRPAKSPMRLPTVPSLTRSASARRCLQKRMLKATVAMATAAAATATTAATTTRSRSWPRAKAETKSHSSHTPGTAPVVPHEAKENSNCGNGSGECDTRGPEIGLP